MQLLYAVRLYIALDHNLTDSGVDTYRVIFTIAFLIFSVPNDILFLLMCVVMLRTALNICATESLVIAFGYHNNIYIKAAQAIKSYKN